MRVRRELLPDLLQTGRIDIRWHLLLKVADAQVIALLHTAGKRWNQSKDTLQKRRLADSVRAGQHNLLPTLHLQIQWRGQRLLIADHQILRMENIAAGRSRHLKVELRLRLLRRQLDLIHLVQLLLAGHRHVAGRYTGFISRHKVLQICNFLLLTVICCLDLCLTRRVNLLKLIIITRIASQRLLIHMVNQVDHAVQEGNIMGNQDKGILILIQISLQPYNMLCIQVVRRLVQKKDIRLLQQQLCQKNLRSLTAGQLRDVTVKTKIQ